MAYGVGGGAIAYLALLIVLGFALRGTVASTVRDRLAVSLDGQATVGDATLDLVRGGATVRELVVERQHLGTLRLAIDRVEVDLAPLGAVVLAREARMVRVVGAHLTIAGAGALELPPRPPSMVTVGGLDVTASDVDLVVTTAWPELAHVRLVIERFRAGRTTFRTPLSWVFALEELDARVELTGTTGFALRYRDGRLSAQGGVFGDTPVDIEVTLPRDPGPDEPARLRALAFELAKRLAIERGKRWLTRRLLFSKPF